MYKEVPDALHLAVTLACSMPKARHLVASEEGLLIWLASQASFTPQVGADYRLDLEQKGAAMQGSIQGYDAASGIVYTVIDEAVKKAFGSTIARWSWEPLSPDFTLVTLTHTGHGQGDVWQRAYEQHVKSWTFYLSNLVSVVNEGRDQRS